MKIIKKINEMQSFSDEMKVQGKTIACVPTMGYFHEGHLSLMQKGKSKADICVVTLFVNPTQFAPNEDFGNYPRNFDRDRKLAESAGADVIFNPELNEMYPPGFSANIHIGGITKPFEGYFRPNHFDGVATVVTKLFNAVRPNMAFFGQKDYQQSLLIRKLNDDLNLGIDIRVEPIVRESDGLAMSSRNSYLSENYRKKTSIVFRSLEKARTAIESGEHRRKVINAIMHKELRTVPEIRIDYAASADSRTLEIPEEFFAGQEIVLLIAAYIGKTRLIDNAVLKIPEK